MRQMKILAGSIMKVMTVRRQLACTIKTSTIIACVMERTTTFTFKQIWSATVVVSAASLLVISPAQEMPNDAAFCKGRKKSYQHVHCLEELTSTFWQY